MSTLVIAAQFLPLTVGEALLQLAVCAAAIGFLVLFKPLLRGLALATLLLVKPKLQRLQRRQMRDAALLKRMMNSQKASPSEAAELQALASRA